MKAWILQSMNRFYTGPSNRSKGGSVLYPRLLLNECYIKDLKVDWQPDDKVDDNLFTNSTIRIRWKTRHVIKQASRERWKPVWQISKDRFDNSRGSSQAKKGKRRRNKSLGCFIIIPRPRHHNFSLQTRSRIPSRPFTRTVQWSPKHSISQQNWSTSETSYYTIKASLDWARNQW